MTPTSEQQAIVEAAAGTSDNLRLVAYAGAAKTTTLELVCKRLSSTPILSLAFNRKIADEMSARLPGHVKAQTLNSLGHRVWMQGTSKKLRLAPQKTKDSLQALIERVPKHLRADYREEYMTILRGVGAAKAAGYIPSRHAKGEASLLSRAEFMDTFDTLPDPLIVDAIEELLTISIAEAYDGVIDFDDQIYMSTLFGGTFPRFPLVLVDEAQDLSPINHKMLQRLAGQRIIAVGDPCQSIYGFRGAVHGGMDYLAGAFSTRDMKLSTSFRCPQSVVREAWFRVPDMRWADWAEPGAVYSPTSWGPSDVPDGAVIICRYNAPLLSMAFKLLRAQRGVKIVGRDIGPGLVRILRKLAPETAGQTAVLNAIALWRETELVRTPKKKRSIEDRADCLRVFAEQATNLAGAISFAEAIFKQEGPIQLCTGHKAKGLEWADVFFLDTHLIGERAETEEEKAQEENLRYVGITRSKSNLWYVRSDNYASL